MSGAATVWVTTMTALRPKRSATGPPMSVPTAPARREREHAGGPDPGGASRGAAREPEGAHEGRPEDRAEPEADVPADREHGHAARAARAAHVAPEPRHPAADGG